MHVRAQSSSCGVQREAEAQAAHPEQACPSTPLNTPRAQLGYREYARYLAFHFPFIHERSLLAHLRACPWRMDQVGW